MKKECDVKNRIIHYLISYGVCCNLQNALTKEYMQYLTILKEQILNSLVYI